MERMCSKKHVDRDEMLKRIKERYRRELGIDYDELKFRTERAHKLMASNTLSKEDEATLRQDLIFLADVIKKKVKAGWISEEELEERYGLMIGPSEEELKDLWRKVLELEKQAEQLPQTLPEVEEFNRTLSKLKSEVKEIARILDIPLDDTS